MIIRILLAKSQPIWPVYSLSQVVNTNNDGVGVGPKVFFLGGGGGPKVFFFNAILVTQNAQSHTEP